MLTLQKMGKVFLRSCFPFKNQKFGMLYASKFLLKCFRLSLVAQTFRITLNFLHCCMNCSYCHTEFEECFVFAKALKVSTSSAKDENDGCILLSSGDQFASGIAHHQDLEFGNGNQDGNCSDRTLFTEGSFQLHYKGHRSVDFVFHEYTIGLNDVDLHCYPLIFGRLIAFYERLSSCGPYSMRD